MKVGSLFSGIGGIEIGFERAGFKTEWFIDNEPYTQAILRKRFPKAKIYGDITKIDFTTIPEVDILTGGFPCQDISNAGKRAGIEGSCSSLWKYFLEAIRTLRPGHVLIENVSALINRGLNVVLADLASIGYDAEWHCVSASSVGALHKRDRIFILAYIQGKRIGKMAVERKQKKENIDIERKGDDVSNSSENRWKRSWEKQVRHQEFSNTPSRGCQTRDDRECCQAQVSKRKQREDDVNQDSGRRDVADKSGIWATEPRLGRVADGIPNRVDRIRCLGNAVVPQVAEIFAQAIREKMR